MQPRIGEFVTITGPAAGSSRGRAHYAYDQRGDLVETTAEHSDGIPNWEHATEPADSTLSVPVQGALRVLLNYAAGEDDEDEDALTGRIDLEAVAMELRKRNVHAIVEDSAGNTATLYVGNPRLDLTEGISRYPAIGGPGQWTGPGWTGGWAWADEFSFGKNDGGASDHDGVPEGATAEQIAEQIAAFMDALRAAELALPAPPPPMEDAATTTMPFCAVDADWRYYETAAHMRRDPRNEAARLMRVDRNTGQWHDLIEGV